MDKTELKRRGKRFAVDVIKLKSGKSEIEIPKSEIK